MTLFTYGSLMFPEVWRRVAGEDIPSVAATLDGFAAWKVRGEAYPGLAPAPGESTHGRLYLEVSPAAASRLDAFEGPFYERQIVDVTTTDGTTRTAHAYVVAAPHRPMLEPVRWDADEFRMRHLSTFLGPRRCGDAGDPLQP